MYFKKIISVGTMALLLASCTNPNGQSAVSKHYTQQQISEKETFYQSSRDYRGLISLYREVLKQREDEQIRYKLAESYYLIGDSKASNLYLRALLGKTGKLGDEVRLLVIKNHIQLSEYRQAIEQADQYLQVNDKDGQGYNLRGIAYAHSGNLDQAYRDIMAARERFISDSVAVNNLAMLNILDKQYRNAVNLLLPQYLGGERESRLIYNLVFSLVKSGDLSYAKDIIQKEKLNTSAEQLINALQRTEKNSTKVKR